MTLALSDYPDDVTVRRITERTEITEAGAHIQVSLDLALRHDTDLMAIVTEGSTHFLELRASNGTVTYRIDGFDLGRLVLLCSLVYDGRRVEAVRA